MADHREISRRAPDAYTTGDFAGLEDAYTAGHVIHDEQNPFAAEQHGLDALRAMVTMYRKAFPDLVMTTDAQYEDGDVVVNRGPPREPRPAIWRPSPQRPRPGSDGGAGARTPPDGSAPRRRLPAASERGPPSGMVPP